MGILRKEKQRNRLSDQREIIHLDERHIKHEKHFKTILVIMSEIYWRIEIV